MQTKRSESSTVLSSKVLFILAFFYLANVLIGQDRPNIVWIVSEDNSKHYMALYEKGGAVMPNIERLAKQGIVFNNAFSQAPVCSVARSTIISGCYAPRVGAQYHRRTKSVPMPDGLKMFPYYLKQAGYYTTNNSKEDYNIIKTKDVWDFSSNKSTYRNRKEGQPFFHVQNFGITHEGKLHFKEVEMEANETTVDPETITPFPYHPQTPLFQYTYAWYYELHKKVDEAIGKFLKQLEEDGLMDDTFIFYYGDHGGVLPGSKGYIYERGLHVPMVVYVPEKWKHLVPATRGSRVDGFVRFIDLGPTVLNLAGIEVPPAMDGKPFLGKGVDLKTLNARDRAFSYADRFDEKYDLVRAIRIGKYKYMRNYQPFNFDGLYNFYRYRMLAYKEWQDLYKAGKLNEAQRQFFEKRPAESLYNIEDDPHEVKNLVVTRKKRSVLKRMRKEMQRQVKSMPDLSFFPESHLIENAWDNPVLFGQNNKSAIARLVDIADLSVLPFKKAKPGIAEALNSSDRWHRYWGLIVCSSFGKEATEFYGKAKALAKDDEENLVRARAAEFLGLTRSQDPTAVMVDCLKKAKSPTEANLILNSIVLLRDTEGYEFPVSKEMVRSDWLKGRVSLVRERLIYLGVDTKID